MTDPRIEEMTADQRVEAAAIALAEWEHDEVAFQPVRLDGVTRSGQSEDYYRKVARLVLNAADGESAATSPVPGLSVCVAQLAAIRQLAEAAALAIGRVEALCDNLGADFDRRDIRRAIGHEKPWLAVLDGVPGTTQETTHWCPPGDAGLTTCCGRSPFELPKTDRMTLDESLVTCRGTTQPD